MTNFKETYETPFAEVIVFDVEDVIVASNGAGDDFVSGENELPIMP